MLFQQFLLGVGSKVRGRQPEQTGPALAEVPEARRPAVPSCSHPAEALVSSRAGGLGRAWVQTCECGEQWVIRP